ncbi:MAG: type IV pilin-like G/H family protein [Cyanobacteriota bacterium]|nr:type IV pilin-like G/H family protein [Cyanobacteriota bacterium]
MQIIRDNLNSIFTKIIQFSRGGVIVVISALFLLGAGSDKPSGTLRDREALRMQHRSIEERQLEAQEYIDLINRGQQAYYSERSSFTNRIEELGLDIPTETENYSYRIQTLEEERVLVIAIPKNKHLKSYTGAAFLEKVDGYFRGTQSIVCESDRPSQVPPSTAWVEGRLICGLNSSPPIANLSVEARQLEAKRYISSMNKGQQAYYIENSSFTDKIEELGLGIRNETESYRYQIKTFDDRWVVTTATPKFNDLKSYTGAVFVTLSQGDFITTSIVCESDKPSFTPPLTAWLGEEVKCVFGSSLLE